MIRFPYLLIVQVVMSPLKLRSKMKLIFLENKRLLTEGPGIVLFDFCFDSLPCILALRCLRDTCIPEEIMFRDPRRLYAPGRLYHIVERKPFR